MLLDIDVIGAAVGEEEFDIRVLEEHRV
jgi:hypothetical protein